MLELMTALGIWAGAATGLPVPDSLPEVKRADRCEIHRFVYDDPEANCNGALRIYAAYSEGVMWLPNEWRADSLVDVSILLHEMVHHLQYEAGHLDNITCKGPVEKVAYDAQIAFLNAAGVDPMEVLGLNGMTLMLITQCDMRY